MVFNSPIIHLRRFSPVLAMMLIALFLSSIGCDQRDAEAEATASPSASADAADNNSSTQGTGNERGVSGDTASSNVERTGGQSEHTSVTVERVTTVREKTVTETRKEAANTEQPVVAIFVKNRAGDEYDEKIVAMEDLLSSRLAEAGFRVMSREDVINSVASFGDAGPNAGDPDLAGAELDKALSNNTSALRLAQNMGADYILTASIVSINHNRKRFKGYDIDRTVFESILRGSYKVLDRTKGGSLTGGTVESTVKSPFQDQVDESTWGDRKHTYAEEIGAVDNLVDEAATKLAAHLEKRRERVDEPADEAESVKWTVICGTTDMVVPTVVRTDDNDFVVGEQELPVNPMNVTVELNGVVVGTAPGTFEVPPGLSKLRLTREGYKDIERTVNVVPGQTLRIDMQMTDKEYARWKDMIAFLERMKAGNKLTDAQAEQIRGFAQMLRQSGFKVNIDSDLKGVVDQSIW